MITSTDNPKVKQARALSDRRGRERQGRCLAEGVRLIEDAVGAGVHPAFLFFTAEGRVPARAAALLAALEAAGTPVWEVSPEVYATLSDTVTPQGVVAVLPIPRLPPPSEPALYLVLDQVRDPGNLGTILRSAEAAGAGMVLLARGCADPWSPKVVRSGMGAHFRLPLRTALDWRQIDELLAGRPLWLADAHGTLDYDRVDWTGACALAVGGETEGIGEGARSIGAGLVRIPMAAGAESLNAAMAATVLLFEAARQRRAVR